MADPDINNESKGVKINEVSRPLILEEVLQTEMLRKRERERKRGMEGEGEGEGEGERERKRGMEKEGEGEREGERQGGKGGGRGKESAMCSLGEFQNGAYSP